MVATPPLPPADDPEAALAAVVALRRLAASLEADAVAAAIEQGWTWAQVGEALGVSGQAAHKKLASRIRVDRGPQPKGSS